MYITQPQHSILELLREFGCLRKDQIVKIINKKYNIKTKPVKSVHLMLDQLVLFNKIVTDDKYFSLPHYEEDARSSEMITAFDIMLGITKGKIVNVNKGSGPINLLFTFEIPGEKGKEKTFAIITRLVDEKSKRSIEILSDSGVIMIFLIDSREQRFFLDIPNKYYFVVRKGEWKFEYYKAPQKENTE